MNTLDDLLNSLFREEIKQKEWITLSTNYCDVYKKCNTFSFMGYSKRLPEQLVMEFTLTNDHIERGGEKIDQPYMINFNFNYN